MINDHTRPQARKCVSEMPELGCDGFESCIMGPDLDDDDDW